MADAPETIQVQPESVTDSAAGNTPTSNAEGTQAVLSDDEALDRILGSSSTEEREGDGKARDAHGRFAKKESETTETSQDTETADASASLNPELAKAVAALKRDGWEDADISLLPEARRIELGSKRAKAQSDQDAFSARSGREAQSESKAAEPKEAPRPDPDIAAAVEQFVEAYGEESREPFSKIVSALDAKYQKQVAPVVQAIQSMVYDNLKAAAFESRQTLEKQYPQLKDEQRRAEVADAMELFYRANPQKFNDVGTLMASACKYVFAEEQMAAMKNQMAQKHDQRRDAVPTSVARKNGASNGKPQDRDDEVLDLILSGNKEQAKAMARN